MSTTTGSSNVRVSRKIGTVVLGGLDDDDDEAEVTVTMRVFKSTLSQSMPAI